jgi:hypothetical protein
MTAILTVGASVAGVEGVVGVGIGAGIGAVASTFSAAVGQRHERRVRHLLEALVDRMQHLDEAKLDHAYLGTDAFRETVLDAVDAAAQSRSERLVDYHAAILLGAMRVDRDRWPDPRSLIAALAQLTDADVEAARYVYENPPMGMELPVSPGKARRPEMPFAGYHLQRAAAVGLLFSPPEYDGEGYLPTDGFKALMELLKEIGVPPSGRR